MSFPPAESTMTPPFDKGDVVIRSSDNVDFLMYKIDLSRASPIFETMFSLPQPSSTPPAEETGNDLPIVELAESEETLRLLLSFCLPKQYVRSTLGDISDVAHILEAARKYEMNWLVDVAREAMRDLAEKESIRVYAVACRFGLEEEATVAARLSLRMSNSSIFGFEAEELDHATANQFRHLVKYKDDCQTAVKRYLESSEVKVACDTFDAGCGYAYGHNRAWTTRYITKLSSVLKDCVWEGAVQPEIALNARMAIPSEICVQCVATALNRLTLVTERIASDVAKAISEIQFVF